MSGDVETNPGPLDQSSNPEQPLHSVSLLETRLSQLGRIPLDVGGGGDCFFRAVSHQLYGTPNNHYQVRSLGIHHLLHNPKQFIESNAGHSWQEYLNNMSCEGTWADAIIIQAVASCLSLRIHIAESLATFAPVTIVKSVTGECASIYIGHIGEAHYVPTAQKQVSQISNKNKIDMTLTGSKDITDQKEKHKAYMKEYVRKRRSDPNFRNKEKKKMCQNQYKKIEAEKRNKTASKRRMANADHVREINRQSLFFGWGGGGKFLHFFSVRMFFVIYYW